MANHIRVLLTILIVLTLAGFSLWTWAWFALALGAFSEFASIGWTLVERTRA